MNNKKILLSILFTLLVGSFIPAKAQFTLAYTRFGFKLSPSIAWLKANSSGLTSTKNKIGFGYGLIADFGFSENYAFGTGLEIVYKGGVIEGTDPNGNKYKETFDLQYLEVPLTLKMRTNQIGQFKYYGQFGLCPGFNIDAGGDVEVNGTSLSNVNMGDYVNLFNCSIIFSVGTEFHISGNTMLLTGLTFNNGFINIVNDGKGSKAITNYLALNVGVLF